MFFVWVGQLSGRLEKDLGNSEDLLARVVARNKHGQNDLIIERVETCHRELHSCLKTMRSFLADSSLLGVSDEITPEKVMLADQFVGAAQSHQQGMAELIKEMKGSL